MNKKMSHCIVIMLGFLLFSSSIVFAKDVKNVIIPELGTITLPADIEVTENTTKQGNKGLSFLMKDPDQDVFRTLTVYCKLIPNIKLGAVAEKPDLIQSFVGQDRILKSDPLKSVVIGKKKVLEASLTSFRDYFAFNVRMYCFENTDGVVMLIFMSTDGDSTYWEDVRNTIITDAKE